MGLGLAHGHPHLLRRQLCGLGQSLKRDEIMRSIFLAQLTFMCGIMSKSEKIHFLGKGFRIRDEIPPGPGLFESGGNLEPIPTKRNF